MNATTDKQYTVYSYRAGYSGSRKWVKTYSSLSAAMRKADDLTGYGLVGVVVNKDDELVHTGLNPDRNVPR